MKKMAFLTLIGLCLLALPIRAQINLLREFAGSPDGSRPYGSLIPSGSTLYGMTYNGGSNGYGAIFKIQTDGTGYTELHAFSGGFDDGKYPFGDLVLSGSTLYGMTYEGGDNNGGTIFKIQTNGTTFTLLHEFAGGNNDGIFPQGSLTLSGSTLYGMTWMGGVINIGTIFKIETSGSGFDLLLVFTGGTVDGSHPLGSLAISGSTLFGMTEQGGDDNMGIIFKIGTSGGGYTLLHEFAGGAGDGAYPSYQSLLLSGSTLYGMTRNGGPSDFGTIFKIQTDGSGFTVVHEFAGGTTDGVNPNGSLFLYGSTLYGMTYHGGSSNKGTIFKIQTDGSGHTILHEFTGGADDGGEPYGSLILEGSSLFGMTQSGGNSNLGVIFSYSLYNDIYIFDGHDFNDDGGSDVSVFRPSNNFWYIKGVDSTQWGASGDKPVSGDYDNDGKTDVAVFRPSLGKWFIRRSSTGTALNYFWGANGDVPVPGDYDADNITDVAIWRPSTGKWMIKGSAGTNTAIFWGADGDIPAPGDYDGDSKADMATFRASAGKWYIKGSAGTNYAYNWGQSGDTAVAADYDGDGKDDMAVFRAAAAKWYIKGSMGTNYTYTWGQSGDMATPGDYDKDGKADVAIFRASAGKWMIKGSAGTNYTYTWGTSGDVALVK